MEIEGYINKKITDEDIKEDLGIFGILVPKELTEIRYEAIKYAEEQLFNFPQHSFIPLRTLQYKEHLLKTKEHTLVLDLGDELSEEIVVRLWRYQRYYVEQAVKGISRLFIELTNPSEIADLLFDSVTLFLRAKQLSLEHSTELRLVSSIPVVSRADIKRIIEQGETWFVVLYDIMGD